MGEAYIQGHQGHRDNLDTTLRNRTKAAVCLKHYIGYSNPTNGRDRSNANIPEFQLRELYLPPFAKAIAAGAQTVMINSASVNGIPGHANAHYINDILKGELNFTGFVVSDWRDVIRLHTRDKVAETPEEAVRLAVMAGIDMSMVPEDYSFIDHCVNLYEKDLSFAGRVNDATKRILRVKETLGLFEDSVYPVVADLDKIGTDESESFNLEAARESIILAKNANGILPLGDEKDVAGKIKRNRERMKILVTGPSGNILRALNGGWSYTWQGRDESKFVTYGRKKYTVYEGI